MVFSHVLGPRLVCSESRPTAHLFQIRGSSLEKKQAAFTEEVQTVQVQETAAERAEAGPAAGGGRTHNPSGGRHYTPPVQGSQWKQRRW